MLIKAWKYLGEQLYILHFCNNITVIATSYLDEILKSLHQEESIFTMLFRLTLKSFIQQSLIINSVLFINLF